jgi:hypothetical protein
MLPLAIVASALFALLAFAPFASATPDPVASGSTKLTLQKNFVKYLGTFGIKIAGTGKAKVKGSSVTFPVSGGSVDPTTGAGTLTHKGGLKLTAGKTNVKIGALEVNTKKKMLTGKAGGKKIQLATLAGLKVSRNGFGANLNANKVKLTAAGANALNKALGFAGGKPLPFLKNKKIGSSKSEEQPKETALVPGGAMTFALNAELARKLNDVKAQVVPLTGTTVLSATPPVFSFPITGGTFSASGTAGTVQSAGGLSLVQKLSIAGKTLDTNITLGGFYYDLQAKTITVEVSATSTASKDLNLGALGRSSVANVTIGGVLADPKTRSVAVQNSSAVLQPLSGEVLNGFVKVFAEVKKGETELEAQKLGKEAEALGAEAKKDGEEAGKLAAEAKAAGEAGETAKKEEKEKAAAAKGKEAEDKKAAAEAKGAAAKAKLAEAAPAAAKVLSTDAIAGGQPLGLISFSGQAQ